MPNPAPEGHLTIARRFSAGKSGRVDSSPEGRLKFSRAQPSATITAFFSMLLLAAEASVKPCPFKAFSHYFSSSAAARTSIRFASCSLPSPR
jgi:hypothetical protein